MVMFMLGFKPLITYLFYPTQLVKG